MTTIHIFISSTFKDMDAERDLIVSQLRPCIEQQLLDRHIHARVQLVDLRWGVNTQDIPEEQRENKVLDQCLDYIRTSRPFFIGLLGDRYGWIPPQERWDHVVGELSPAESVRLQHAADEVRSVTELEMLFGALYDSEALPSSFFFLRNPEVYAQMDDRQRAVYCDTDPGSRQKLQCLRQKVQTTYQQHGYSGNVIPYDCTWDGHALKVDPAPFLSIVQPIVRSILNEILLDEAQHTRLDDAIAADMALIDERESYFCGRRDTLRLITRHLDNDRRPLVILAPKGAGKTSMMAHIFQWAHSSFGDWIPLIHFTQPDTPDAFLEVMLKKFLWQLPAFRHLARPMNVETHPALLLQYLRAIAAHAQGRLLLIIDDVQHLQQLQYLMPLLTECSEISVILSTEQPIAQLQDGVNACYLRLETLDPAVVRTVIRTYMARVHKSLPNEVVEAILLRQDPASHLPAYASLQWLTDLLDQLIGLDLEDFARLRSLDAVNDADRITQYLLQLVARAPFVPASLCHTPLTVLPADPLSWQNYLLNQALRFRQLQLIAQSHGLNDADEAFASELHYRLDFFAEDFRQEVERIATSQPWEEAEALNVGADFATHHRQCRALYEAFRQQPSFDRHLLLDFAFYLWCSQCQCLLSTCTDEPSYAYALGQLDAMQQLMRSASQGFMLTLFSSNLLFYLREEYARRFENNLLLAAYYGAQQEKYARLLHQAYPASIVFAKHYAGRMDENAAYGLSMGNTRKAQERYIKGAVSKCDKSIQIYTALYQQSPDQALLADLAMVRLRRVQLLVNLDADAALSSCRVAVDEIITHRHEPHMERLLAIGYDALAKCYLSKQEPDKALEAQAEAYDLFCQLFQQDTTNVELLHSILNTVKSRIDILAQHNRLPADEVERYRQWADADLAAHPKNGISQINYLQARVVEMCHYAMKGDAAAIIARYEDTARLIEEIAFGNGTLRFLECQYFLPVLECINRFATPSQRLQFATRYNAMRERLINARLMRPDYLPAL